VRELRGESYGHALFPADLRHRRSRSERADARPRRRSPRAYAGQLATLGLRPADIDLVVNSHLHFDHCGGNRHFAHCPLLLQAAELEAAHAPVFPYQDFTGWNEPGLRYQSIQGDHTLAPGVELLTTPGHTPGH
jgi:N-acyl homoserine lactone hydrolase